MCIVGTQDAEVLSPGGSAMVINPPADSPMTFGIEYRQGLLPSIGMYRVKRMHCAQNARELPEPHDMCPGAGPPSGDVMPTEFPPVDRLRLLDWQV